MRPALLLVLPIALPPALAAAATGEEWGRFRAEVEAACRAALDAAMDAPAEVTVEVNPVGSESYGVALLTVEGEGWADRYACVTDKATGAAELTGAFDPPAE